MVVVLAIAIMGFFATIAFLAKPLDPLTRTIKNFSFSDIYYEILRETSLGDTCRVITIVDLTRLTNRTAISETIEEIEAAHPKVLTVDACFDNFGEDLGGNILISDIASKYSNIVWSMKCLDYENDTIGWRNTIHSFFTEDIKVKEGTSNMPRANQYDSMKRKYSLFELVNKKHIPSLVLSTANLYSGKDLSRQRTGDVEINFSPTVFRKIQPEDVKNHRELLDGQIVLLGSLYEDVDFHWTPIGKIAGVELLAYSIQTILLDKQPREMPVLMFCILSVLIIFVTQTLQARYISMTSSSKNLFVRYVVGSGYIMGICTFLFTSVFLGLGFLLFSRYNIIFNVAWAISVIAFLGTSRSMFSALKNYYEAGHPVKKMMEEDLEQQAESEQLSEKSED